MQKSFLDFIPLEEGVNDPGIFKAVFLAGGPGSGKSFIVGKTALTSLGLKLVNSDDAFEALLRKAKIEATPENIFSDKGQTIRGRAKSLTQSRQKGFIDGRLGLVIDGTGKDFAKIQKQVVELRKLGYECAMVFVNTDLETAQNRNAARARTLPSQAVSKMWNDVQRNIGKFQNLFGRYMFIVDNSDGANWEGATMSVYRRVSQWVKEPTQSPAAKRWVQGQKKSRGIKEGKEHSWKSEGHYTKDGKEWKGPQHAHDGQVMTGEKHTDDSQNLYHFKELPKPVQQKLLAKMKLKEDLGLPPMQKLSKLKPTKSLEQRRQAKRRESNKPFDAKIKDNAIDEVFRWMMDPLAKTVHRTQYRAAAKLLKQIIDRKKKEGGGRLRHGIEWYALKAAKQVSDKVDARTLANMVKEGYDPVKHEWGTDAGRDYYLSLTPGQKKKKIEDIKPVDTPIKEDCGCEEDDDWMEYLHKIELSGFSDNDIAEIDNEIDSLTFDDMVDMGLYDDDELEEVEVDVHDDINITEEQLDEVLSIQGRMKRRFHARRNRQKLKVARMRRSRMASDPGRIKMRAARGARVLMKKRLARGRDIGAMPPAEKARIETLLKRFQPLVTKMAQRMIPQVRKAEMGRLKKRGSMKPQASKKFKIKKGGSASKYKAKKFKIKKAGKK